MIRILIALLFLSQAAAAAEPEVALSPPRDHGWWIGDVLTAEAVVTVGDGLVLDPSSLPKPRAVTYWLDLRRVDLTEANRGEGVRAYALSLQYQTFYAPLEPKRMTVPPVSLAFRRGDDLVAVTIPPWSFVTSPVREILAPTVPEALRDPAPPAVVDTIPLQVRAGSLVAVACLLAAGLAWHRNAWPFRRENRPFSLAAAAVRRALARSAGDPGYRDALVAVHRGFDAAFGRRMQAGDVEAFLAERPAFAALADRIRAFFEASRRAFFGPNPAVAETVLPPGDLKDLARSLAAVERRRP